MSVRAALTATHIGVGLADLRMVRVNRQDQPMTSTITPAGSRWATWTFARNAEGSSLIITSSGASHTGLSAHRSDGWQLPVGTDPAQLARIVHVTGSLLVGARGATLPLDHFAFCSADGNELVAGLRTGVALTSRPAGSSQSKFSRLSKPRASLLPPRRWALRRSCARSTRG